MREACKTLVFEFQALSESDFRTRVPHCALLIDDLEVRTALLGIPHAK